LPKCATWAEVDEDDLVEAAPGRRGDRAEAERRAKRGQEYVLKNFSWKRVAEGLRDTLDRFVRERHEIVDARQLKAPSAKKITVVIPTYNRADALDRCLAAYKSSRCRRNIGK